MKLNKKNFTGIALVIVALLSVAIICYQNRQTFFPRDWSEIQEEGVLRVVTDYNAVGYYASSDTIAGFNHELLEAIAREANLKFEISVENNLEKNIEGLNEGKYDIIARNIPSNGRFRDTVAFTKAIAHNKLVLVQRKPVEEGDKPLIRSHLDLAKITIHVPNSSPTILRLDNLAQEIGDTIYIIEDSLYETPQLIMEVAAGDIDYTVCDSKMAARMAKQMPEIDFKTDIGFTHIEAWALRKSSPILLDSLNVWIDRVQKSKEYQRIINKYYK